jgi:hypothetical protein
MACPAYPDFCHESPSRSIRPCLGFGSKRFGQARRVSSGSRRASGFFFWQSKREAVGSRPVSLHKKYVELITAESEAPTQQRPRDVADRLLELRDLRKLSDDESSRETFTLPLHAARLKARQILNEYPQSGYTTVVECWRQLPDGQIEFTMRRLPTAN